MNIGAETTGLKWAPDTFWKRYTSPVTIRAPPNVDGTMSKSVYTATPQQIKTNKRVPINSAKNFCFIEGSLLSNIEPIEHIF